MGGGGLSPALHSALPLGPGPKELGVLSWGNLERLVGIRSHQRPTQTQLPLPTDTKSSKPRATMACQASPSTLSRILNSPTLGGSRGLDTPFTETARFVVDFLVPMRNEGECCWIKHPDLATDLGVGGRCPGPWEEAGWAPPSLYLSGSTTVISTGEIGGRRSPGSYSPEVTNLALPGPETYFWSYHGRASSGPSQPGNY